MRHRDHPQIRRGSCQDNPVSTPSGTRSGGTHCPPRRRSRRSLHRLRGLGCSGSWCKPRDAGQPLSHESVGSSAVPSVSALAANMLQRGWVTREEYAQLLLGDRIYHLHEASQVSETQRVGRQRKRGKLQRVCPFRKSNATRIVRGLRSRSKAGQSKKKVGAALVSKATERSSKAENKRDPCRDPITLDDLGSWTWDFRAAEAATPPVSCGGVVSKSGEECPTTRKRSGSLKGRKGNGGSKCNAVVTYNVESLVLYLLESGDFQEPTTRRPFSLVQLADLDALAARAGAKVKGSLVTSFREGQAKYRERRERREMLVGVDRCLGDIVADMLSTIEDSEEPHEEAHVYLVTLFPQFSHIYSELKEADEEFARHCLHQYKSTLEGPPNRPTLEKGGLLRTTIEFLNEQEGRDDESSGDATEDEADTEVEGEDGAENENENENNVHDEEEDGDGEDEDDDNDSEDRDVCGGVPIGHDGNDERGVDISSSGDDVHDNDGDFERVRDD